MFYGKSGGKGRVMAYKIKHRGKVVEEHIRAHDAERAFWTLTAHELKNGRIADLELDLHGAHGVCFPDECVPALPEWAMEILKAHDLWRP